MLEKGRSTWEEATYLPSRRTAGKLWMFRLLMSVLLL